MVPRLKAKHRRGSPIGKLLIDYKPGDKVIIEVDPSFHKGVPYKRFRGKVGVIREERGRAYVVEVTDGRKKKEVIVRVQHLRLLRG